jgi:ADP-ribose pyrophosphatase YjhB (NUDIX family)
MHICRTVSLAQRGARVCNMADSGAARLLSEARTNSAIHTLHRKVCRVDGDCTDRRPMVPAVTARAHRLLFTNLPQGHIPALHCQLATPSHRAAVLTREIHGERQFLLQERSVNPQHGMWSEPGGKIPYGMLIGDAARHYMQRQTGLLCDVTLRGVTHYVDDYRGNVVQDRYFFIFVATDPQGELLAEGPRGKNIWRSYAEIQSSDHALPDLLAQIDMAQRDDLGFKEGQFTLDDF